MVNVELISARAIVPDQLAAYVSAIGAMKSSILGDCILHQLGDAAVLVGYPPDKPEDMRPVNEAVEKCLANKTIRHLSVLAPEKPEQVPPHASIKRDAYWFLPLPARNISAKMRNMLKRGARDLKLDMQTGASGWSKEHKAVIEEFCERKKEILTEADIFIFKNLSTYLAACPDSALFSARTQQGELATLAIADYSSLCTAFYMFAFRRRWAPPGAADALLNAICAEAVQRGHAQINLGLGIDEGVAFFKRKWGAKALLPFTECSWTIRRKSWFGRLFGKQAMQEGK